jgi:hypothetical protein
MLVGIREWTFEGGGGCVAMRVRAREPPVGDAAADRLAVELSRRGRFRGCCVVGLPATELVRFHSEFDALLAGREPRATLGGVGGDLGLTFDAVPGGAA